MTTKLNNNTTPLVENDGSGGHVPYVALASGGSSFTSSVEFTRPSDTTAYTAGDVVSDSTSATTVQALAGVGRLAGGFGYITGIHITTDKKSVVPNFRLHLYNANTPTVSVDNAAHQDKYADEALQLGCIDVPSMLTGVDTTNSTMSHTWDMSIRFPFKCAAASTSIYFTLEALTAFTPASGEKFTVRIWGEQN